MLPRTLHVQKEVCNVSFTIATSVQENCENILKDTLELFPWMPKEQKGLCLYCSEQYRLSLSRLKKTSLASIDLFERFSLPPTAMSEKKPERRKKAAPAEPKKPAAKTRTEAKSNEAVKKQPDSTLAETAATAVQQESAAKIEQAVKDKPGSGAGNKKNQAPDSTVATDKS